MGSDGRVSITKRINQNTRFSEVHSPKTSFPKNGPDEFHSETGLGVNNGEAADAFSSARFLTND